ncbi:2-oxoglutarate and iron-dependent oxygenase domain-containing protein CP2 isoform X3 [Elaeis guineensis]|uniref:Uncharacterized PKHD-type hydroxylase At1g22950 isoform X2 n=1 Tax=Elaeis guineensis var. tenera TaxID=51953 RepID=A0A8N4I9H0_ELAGV|nr:uncharacterized PKHD-type hydroxylase At1g22950 isoform X2 [Elaeis guineensis]
MSLDGAVERREDPPAGNGNGNGAVAVVVAPPTGRPTYGDRRLRLNPNTEHKPERYDDLETEFDPSIFSSLERHLPPTMLEVPRDAKIQFMKEILARYLPEGERTRVQRHKEYRQKIMSAYLVENFEKWVNAVKFKIMRPNTMNKYGAVLDDFGLEPMLSKLMEEFICPMSKVFFPEVGGSTLDSHHGFVVEYGKDKDLELGFHVDDSEITLNVCLGKQFSGGELFFRGVRCDKHVNSDTQPEEILDYSHVPGQAILHRGRHRHGARATTSGHRINLLLWCRSSVFREMKKYQKDFSSWCGECQRERKERQRHSVAATKLAFLRSGGSII